MGKNKKNVRTENKLDSYFKEQLQSFNAEPPQFMWNNIEEQLNEEREKSKFDHWYYIILALLIPFTIANLYFNYQIETHLDSFYAKTNKQIAAWLTHQSSYSDKQATNNTSIAAKQTKRSNKSFKQTASAKKSNHTYQLANNNIGNFNPKNGIDKKRNKSDRNRLNKNKSGNTSSNPILLNAVKENNLFNNYTESTLALEAKPYKGIQLAENEKTDNFSELKYYASDIQNTTQKKIQNQKGFFLGADVKMNNSRLLLRNNTLQPFFNKNTQYNYEYGYAYALSLGYNISPYFGVETEITYAKQGQSYTDNTIKKLPVSGNIDATYVQIPVLLKYRWVKVSGITQNPMAFNVLMGITFNQLLYSSYTLESEFANAKKLQIPTQELGYTIGLEYDIFMSNNAYLTLGTRASIATDARKFPFVSANKLNTLNVMLGVNASINFQIRQKAKNISTP